MTNHLIKFDLLDWITPSRGLRYKKYVNGRNIIRLAEFSEGFEEKEYCTECHSVYILDGMLSVDFNGKIESYGPGDILFIPSGKKNGHKVVISNKNNVTLLLFETRQISDEFDYCI